jgi:hypothetical protein
VDMMRADNRYQAIAWVLSESLDLRMPPVAICFSESAPPSIVEDAGRVPAGCRFWEDAAYSAFPPP